MALPFCTQGEQTPLHLAAELDAVDCIQLLLKHGANINAQDGQMLTPLLAACAGNCQNASKALMDAGASLTLADEGENTPLHWLVRRDAVELVKLALQKGAPIDALNALSETALLTGVKLGKRNVVELLLKEGATVQRDSIGSKAPTNKTACHFAMQYGAEGGDAADACAILAAILKKKPDGNAVDGEKRSALHYVSARGMVHAIKPRPYSSIDTKDPHHTPSSLSGCRERRPPACCQGAHFRRRRGWTA